ncbi:cation transporter [Rhizobium sp. BK399]|uniref:cation transporter n=1 Tax=Rhizobium sp. BK399 TaxID=2587063 RepID=UPI00160C70EF|nr:cation transporter [Rhizobium sp. BK399]MBB3545542.1 Co/Zn/Cd efflux system component [Rhizobium sp. BK399]
MEEHQRNDLLRKVVIIVALLNLAYFFVEVAVALSIGSVSLFADSVDFLEDASINLLIGLALGWSARQRAKVGMVLATIILVPGLATFWVAYGRFMDQTPPESFALSLTGFGAMLVNLACALMLTAFRHHRGSLTRAAFLSARNDVLANIAIIVAGFVKAFIWPSAWPDLLVGLGIAAINANAAWEVWEAAREEHQGVRS